MILEDFVMLGTTVPEPNSDGRVFVCSAGVSKELRSLVRIYPLARKSVPNRWNMYRVPVERNPRDSRIESWKVAGDRSLGAHDQINTEFQPAAARKAMPDRDRAGLLSPHILGSIQEANARCLSLAIIQPEHVELDFELNPDSPDAPQLALFDRTGEPPSGARRFACIPRLKFRDEGGWHDLMLRDWGTFELQRKNGYDYFRANLAGALRLRDDSSLFIGNMNNRRTAWLVISVLNGIREAPTLFDALPSDRLPIPDKVRIEVFKRDDWRCVRCGSTENLTVDHKWPHIRGGGRTLGNLQTLCRRCQGEKSDHVDGVA